MRGNSNDSTAAYGITDEDITRIKEYLRKQPYDRSVDDLRPSSDDQSSPDSPC